MPTGEERTTPIVRVSSRFLGLFGDRACSEAEMRTIGVVPSSVQKDFPFFLKGFASLRRMKG